MSERIERMAQELASLWDRLRILERDMDRTAERQAQFGRPRYMMWGTLLDDLPAGGAADVQLKARNSAGSWETKQTLEDCLAAPIQPSGSCLPQGTTVAVGWFPLDQEYYVIGGATCPDECAGDSSS